MNRQTWIYIGVALLLGAIYAAFFTDWFSSPPIQIVSRILPGRAAGDSRIVFMLDREYKLNSIRVLTDALADADPKAATMWQLVAATNAVTVTDFGYGDRVKGMKPPPGADAAKPLKPGTRYRLVVASGKKTGSYGFSLPMKPEAPAN